MTKKKKKTRRATWFVFKSPKAFGTWGQVRIWAICEWESWVDYHSSLSQTNWLHDSRLLLQSPLSSGIVPSTIIGELGSSLFRYATVARLGDSSPQSFVALQSLGSPISDTASLSSAQPSDSSVLSVLSNLTSCFHSSTPSTSLRD